MTARAYQKPGKEVKDDAEKIAKGPTGAENAGQLDECEMGTVIATIDVGDLQGRNFQRVEVEVDAGSTHTALPRGMLEGLGVRAERTAASRLADGSEKPVKIGYATDQAGGG